jgi:hypothetical protein
MCNLRLLVKILVSVVSSLTKSGTELIAPNLLKQASENAEREGLPIQFDEGDAEALPYTDASFDAVVNVRGDVCSSSRPSGLGAEARMSTQWLYRDG